jgi:hypothetical protein
MILEDELSWEINISVTANRTANMFAIIVSPQESLNEGNTYMMNGSKFKSLSPDKLDVPLLL